MRRASRCWSAWTGRAGLRTRLDPFTALGGGNLATNLRPATRYGHTRHTGLSDPGRWRSASPDDRRPNRNPPGRPDSPAKPPPNPRRTPPERRQHPRRPTAAGPDHRPPSDPRRTPTRRREPSGRAGAGGAPGAGVTSPARAPGRSRKPPRHATDGGTRGRPKWSGTPGARRRNSANSQVRETVVALLAGNWEDSRPLTLRRPTSTLRQPAGPPCGILTLAPSGFTLTPDGETGSPCGRDFRVAWRHT